MEFRPCIDIHNGRVKQIVGSSLKDRGEIWENFVASCDAADYARLYQEDGLKGGHVILLNPAGTAEYEASRLQALDALSAYPNGLQIGGGIHAENAKGWIDAGASHVIVTSYVFQNAKICYDHLKTLKDQIGRERIVLDLSCRRQGDTYLIVTDRWQKFTDTVLSRELLVALSEFCDEFLVHAVDVEGMVNGIESRVVSIVKDSPIPATYAGGIASIEDLAEIQRIGENRVHATVGSALSIFGGTLPYEDVLKFAGR